MYRHLSGPIASYLAQHQRSSLHDSFKQSCSSLFAPQVSKETNTKPLVISNHSRPRHSSRRQGITEMTPPGNEESFRETLDEGRKKCP